MCLNKKYLEKGGVVSALDEEAAVPSRDDIPIPNCTSSSELWLPDVSALNREALQ